MATVAPLEPLWIAPWKRPLDSSCLLLALLIALPSLWYPLHQDGGVHAYAAWRAMLGEYPYAESIISSKPPFAFLPHCVAFLLAGVGENSIRVMELLLVFGTALLVCRLAVTEEQRDGDLGVALLTTYGLHYVCHSFETTARPDNWVSILLLVVAVRVLGKPLSWKGAFVVGVLCGSACLVKFTAFVVGLPVVGHWLFCEYQRTRDWRTPARQAAACLAGALSMPLLIWLVFFLGGAAGDLIEVLVDYSTLTYLTGDYDGPTAISPTVFLVDETGWLLLTIGGVAAIAGAWRARQSGWARYTVLCLGFAAAVLSAVLQQRWYTYYFAVITPWIAALVVWGLFSCTRPVLRCLLALALVVGLSFSFRYISHTPRTYFGYVRDLVADADKARGDFYGPNHYSAKAIDSLAEFIRRHRRAGDTLCVPYSLSPLYLKLEMRCPSRFHMRFDLLAFKDWRRERQQGMAQSPPTFVVAPVFEREWTQPGYRSLVRSSEYELLVRNRD